jgi:hypothetical protein
MSEELKILVCEQVQHLPVPPLPSVRMWCADCNAEIWASLSGIRQAGKDYLAICIACFGKRDVSIEQIEVPGAEVMAEVREHGFKDASPEELVIRFMERYGKPK